MSDELVVDFGVTGVQDLISGWKAIAGSVSSISAPLARIEKRTERFADASERAALAWAHISAFVGRGANVTVPKTPRIAGSGQAARPQTSAQSIRQQAQMLNAQAALIRAQNNFGNATNPGGGARNRQAQSFGQALKNAILSSRIGIGGGGGISIMPLVGRVSSALSTMGPLGAAANMAVGEIGGLAAISHLAAGKIRELTSARFIGGGSYQETAKAAGLGAALGVGSPEIARMAREFASRSVTDPYARMAAAQTGTFDPFGNMPGFGNLDKMKNFFKAVDIILSAPEDKAIRLAQQFGGEMEKILDLRKMSPGLRDQLLSGTASMFTPEQERAAADYRGTMGLLSQQWDKLLIASTPLIEIFTSIVEVGGDLVSVLGDFTTGMKGAAQKGFDNGFGADMGMNSGKKPEDAKHDDAIRNHTKALNEHAHALKEGAYGGGERIRAATQFRHDRTGRQAAVNLGAFSF